MQQQSDMQQHSDRPRITPHTGALSHDVVQQRQTSRRHSGTRSAGGSPQTRIASQARSAWQKAKDLKQDMNAVAQAKDFEDAPPLKRKRVAACCGVSGLALAAALFSVLFFFFALKRTGLWSLGRRTGEAGVLSIQDIKRGIIDWAMHWQVGLAMYDSWRAVAFAGHWPAGNPSGPQRKLGLRVQLQDVASGKYVRMLTTAEARVGDYGGVVSALVADKDVPWLHGGTFEVLQTDAGRWELVTRAEPCGRKWLETHGSGGAAALYLASITRTADHPQARRLVDREAMSARYHPQAASGGRTGPCAPSPPRRRTPTPTPARGVASGYESGWAVRTTRPSVRLCSPAERPTARRAAST